MTTARCIGHKIDTLKLLDFKTGYPRLKISFVDLELEGS